MTQRDALGLNNDVVSTDLDEYEQLISRDRVHEALQLLDRGFLLGLSLSGTEELDAWLEQERVRLKSKLREGAVNLWAANARAAQWNAAEEAADILLALSPNDEACLRRAMYAKAMAGRPEAAESAFHTFKESQGAGWQPVDEISQLLSRLPELVNLQRSVGATASPDSIKETPLVGRSLEIQRLHQLTFAEAGEGVNVILIVGEAGIGKTRVINEALRPAQVEGWQVLASGFAELERDIALNSLLEALIDPAVERALADTKEPWRSVILDLVPELQKGPATPEVPYVQPGELPRRVFEALHKLLKGVARLKPTVLLLEDLQWADDASIAALQYLRRRWDGGRLIILLSARPEELRPGSRAARFLSELRSRERLAQVDIPPLSLGDSLALVRDMAKGSLSEGEQRAIVALSGQVPFFIVELTLECKAGRLVASEAEIGHVSLPLSIQQVLDHRLSSLTPPSDLILKALAVYGRASRVEEVIKVTDLSLDMCIAALEELQSVRLISWNDGGIILRHQLIRHAVYLQTGEVARRWLHARIASHLSSESPPPVEQLAFHYHRAGEESKAVAFALEAARRAEASAGVAEALGFLEIALVGSSDGLERAQVVGKLAHLHFLHRNFAESVPLSKNAARLFRAHGQNEAALVAEIEQVEAQSQQNLGMTEALSDLAEMKDEARQHGLWDIVAQALDLEIRLLAGHEMLNRSGAAVFNEARECIENGGVSAQCVAHRTLGFHLYCGSPAAALHHARESVRLAQTHDLEHQYLPSLNRALVVLLCQGLLHTSDGVRILTEGSSAAARSGDLYARFNLMSNLGVWHLDRREFAPARRAFKDTQRIIRDTEARWAQLSLLLNLGELCLLEGQVRDAERHFTKAADLLRPGTAPYASRFIDAGLGYCALESGQFTEARERAARLDPLPEQWVHDPTLVVGFRARVLELGGQRDEALQLLNVTGEQVAGRLIMNWFNIKYMESKLAAKSSTTEALDVATPAISLAIELELHDVEARFSLLLSGG